MVLDLKEVLQQVGWSEGYHIPVANDENVRLEAEVERLLLTKANASVQFERLSTRFTALEHHQKCVETETETCQNLLTARTSQLNEEKSMYIAVKMERERLCTDIRTCGSQLEKLGGRKKTQLTDLDRLMTKLTDMKATIQWDEEMIKTWEENLAKKEEDNELIKKFSKDDERRLRELELKRQRLGQEEQSLQDLTVRMARDLETMRSMLFRLMGNYEHMYAARNEMLQQWKDSMSQLQKRDKETMEMNANIESLEELLGRKRESLRDQKQFLNNETQNNAELEATIQMGNLEVSQTRGDQLRTATLCKEYLLEWENLKREVRRTANAVDGKRLYMKSLTNEYNAKDAKMHDILTKIKKLHEQADAAKDTSMSAAERVRKLEDMIQSEEMLTDDLLKDIEKMQGLLYRSRQAKYTAEEIGKNRIIEARVNDTAFNSMGKQLEKKNFQLREMTEIMYKLDFRVSVLDNKLRHLQGTQSNEELEQSTKLIEGLEQDLVKVQDTCTLMQVQIQRLDDNMCKINSGVAADTNKLDAMKYKMKDYMMLVSGATKQLQQYRQKADQFRVQENMLKVRVKCMQRSLDRETNTIYNLQKQLLELEAMMNERREEIGMNRDILLTKKHSLDEERTRLRGDIIARQMKMELLKKRHDCIMSALGKTEDGETLSITFFKIKNAQEKYELQEEGDKLDAQIQKAEKEIIAMENTLRVLNYTNDTYRKSLAIVEEKDAEQVEMERQEAIIHKLMRALRLSSAELSRRRNELQEMNHVLEVTEEDQIKLQGEVKELEIQRKQLQTEADHRKMKFERAYKQIKKLSSKSLDKAKERDFITRHLRDSNRSGLEQLKESCVRYIETGPVISRYFAERNIPLHPSHSSLSLRTRSTLSPHSSTISTGSVTPVTLNLNIPF